MHASQRPFMPTASLQATTLTEPWHYITSQLSTCLNILQAWGLLELQCGNMAAALLLLERSVRQGRSYLCASAREAQVTGQGIRVRAARML